MAEGRALRPGDVAAAKGQLLVPQQETFRITPTSENLVSR